KHFETTSAFHVRLNLLRLLAVLPKWESIVYLIRAISDKDESLAACAQDYVARWNSRYNLHHSTPSPEQRKDLEIELSKTDLKLSAETLKSIHLALRSFSSK